MNLQFEYMLMPRVLSSDGAVLSALDLCPPAMPKQCSSFFKRYLQLTTSTIHYFVPSIFEMLARPLVLSNVKIMCPAQTILFIFTVQWKSVHLWKTSAFSRDSFVHTAHLCQASQTHLKITPPNKKKTSSYRELSSPWKPPWTAGTLTFPRATEARLQ